MDSERRGSIGEATETATAIDDVTLPALALVVHDAASTRLEPLRLGQSLVIGRDASADLRIADAQASRRHVRVSVRPGVLVVEDLGSRNGTRVNGVVVRGEARTVSAGATIQIASCLIIVALEPHHAVAGGEARVSPGIADAEMSSVYARARQVARSAVTVLVLGETGVGKDLLARQIHAHSGRSGLFVRINCAAVADTLLTSELFGHEKGAFTGATERRVGVFERAQGGTLFIDEIGDLPAAAQVTLLNVLETRSFRRVGGASEIQTDARIVCATHRDLRELIARGAFRADLFYRISTFTLPVPPLRERPAELVMLARHLAQEIAAAAHRPEPIFAPGVLDALLGYAWPGNVRELRSALEHALVLASDGVLRLEHFPPAVHTGGTERSLGWSRMRDRLASVERASIEEALAAEEGNQTRAAERLGMPRRTLVAKLAKYGVKGPR